MDQWRDNPIESSGGFRAWASTVEEDNQYQDPDTRIWYSTDGSEVSVFDGPGGFSLSAFAPTDRDGSAGSWLAHILSTNPRDGGRS
jgi:hypothetical protein